MLFVFCFLFFCILGLVFCAGGRGGGDLWEGMGGLDGKGGGEWMGRRTGWEGEGGLYGKGGGIAYQGSLTIKIQIRTYTLSSLHTSFHPKPPPSFGGMSCNIPLYSINLSDISDTTRRGHIYNIAANEEAENVRF